MAEEGWRDLLDQTWVALAGDDPMPAEVAVTGPPARDLLPSTFPVADAALACVASALLAGTALQARRTGRPPAAVSLDAGHVAAAVRSEAYLLVNGKPLGSGFAPLSRFWPTTDGWVRTHANYPWHRDALLTALHTEAEGVADALAALPALEAEQRVVAAGGVAAALRSPEQWLAHPHGSLVAQQPLVDDTRFELPGGGSDAGRDARARRSAYGDLGALPASGMRVLDLTRVIAGPVATRYLAALGADVLRLDPPTRPELPLHRYDGLLGKRSAVLDAASTDGLARLHELLDAADVLVHGYRPGALAAFGLDPADLAQRHPGLVVVALSAWGRHGPWGGRRGFDSIVQVATGIAVRESPHPDAADAKPGALPCQLLDHGTGYLCAAAALDGLRRRAETGGTWVRELSLARTAHWLLSQPPVERAQPAPHPREPARPGEVTGPQDANWLVNLPSAEGPVRTVTPPGALDGAAPRWPELAVRYGVDEPRWGAEQVRVR